MILFPFPQNFPFPFDFERLSRPRCYTQRRYIFTRPRKLKDQGESIFQLWNKYIRAWKSFSTKPSSKGKIQSKHIKKLGLFQATDIYFYLKLFFHYFERILQHDLLNVPFKWFAKVKFIVSTSFLCSILSFSSNNIN